MQYEDVEALYKDLHKQNPGKPEGVAHRSGATAAQQYDFVDRFFYHDDTLLDVGCGYAGLHDHLSIWAGDLGKRYTGYDTNLEALAIAQHRVPKGQLYGEDFRLATLNEKYDLVAIVGTLAWYDGPAGLEICMKAWEYTERTLAIIIHADTVPLTHQDILDYLHPKYWEVDHGWDEFVTGIAMHKRIDQ